MKDIFNNSSLSFSSFVPDASESSYKLQALDDHLIKKVKITLEELERNPHVYLCARGNSFPNPKKHNEFINNDLAKLFIVGEKAKNFLHNKEEEKKTRFYEEDGSSIDDIKAEIESLIEDFNRIVGSKIKSAEIAGKISKECTERILGQSLTNLQGWKVFLLSFLHNDGSKKEFKSASPFLSLTYGPEKITTASSFALKRGNRRHGIIFIYSLYSQCPYYFLAKDITDQLEKCGVSWYEDVHNEVLLLNGMYPHFLIGIFELSNAETSKFILNPWLYKQFKEGIEFNFTEGIDINQRNFREFAEKLGYQRWFFRYCGEQEAFISALPEHTPKKVYRNLKQPLD